MSVILGGTSLSLGSIFLWFSKLFLSVTKQEVDLRASGCCCTKWGFVEYIEAVQKYVNRIKETH